MRTHRLMLAAALTLFAVFAAASPASAEPGNGADVVKYSVCYPFQNGSACYDVKLVSNQTQTPSGNVSSVANGRTRFEMIGTGPLTDCHLSTVDSVHQHSLTKDGTLHEQSELGRGGLNFDCYDEAFKCTYSYHSHYANGRVQFDRPRSEKCVP